MCIATNAASETVAIGLPKCIDADVAPFLTDLPAAFTSTSAAGSLFFRPWSSLVRSFSMLRSTLILANVNFIANPGLGSIFTSTLWTNHGPPPR
jgi:hypothetical protein